jgi:hypothetical protein
MRVLLVKLLMRCTFDVSIDSSGLLSNTPKSAQFVEAFWRRREVLKELVEAPGFAPGSENISPQDYTMRIRLCVVAPDV